ncbi:hypothetical protein OESDEN_21951, partial [Oesophagostomum dentatum]
YPSIYLNFDTAITSEDRVHYVHAVLREAQRISKNYDPPLSIYAYTKFEYDPLKKINDFYNKRLMCLSSELIWGIDGIILWSSSANMTKRCDYIKQQMEGEIGKLIKETVDFHKNCRVNKCGSNGRCILPRTTCDTRVHFDERDYTCKCDPGYESCAFTVVAAAQPK